MPLNLPDKLPAIELLKEENIFVIDNSRANAQDIRPLKIVILNLMPLKITTETDLVRLLSNTPLQLEISFMKLKSHTSKNTPVEHMKAFYRDFDLMRNETYDGMIVTGAPVEQMPYEEVTYWNEITTIFDWARTHVTSTLYICWAAQAGLYHFYGVPKYPLDKKMFGIFEHHINVQGLPIFRGFDDVFFVPHSRHTEVRREDILKVKDLTLLIRVFTWQWHVTDVSSLSPDIPNIRLIHSIRSINAIWEKGFPLKCRRTIIEKTMRTMRHWCAGADMPTCCSPIG